MHNRRSSFSTLRSLQKGVSLLFALMSLVILGLAAVALTRSVDTGTLIMGNLAFKQDTIVAASSGAEQAISWLSANLAGTTLEQPSAANGYYPDRSDKLDPTGNKALMDSTLPQVNWTGSCSGSCPVLPSPQITVNGNKVKWVILRMCDLAGPATGANACARPASTSSSLTSERGELTAEGRALLGAPSPYFRIIVRVEGPRNTVSYTESLVHF